MLTKSPKKISKVLVFSPFYPPHMGGLESHSYEFNQRLAKLGNSVFVLTPNIPGVSPHATRENNLIVNRFPAFEIVANYPFPKFWHPEFVRMISDAVKFRPQVVVSRTRFFLTSLMALLYSRIFSVKWVHIEHGSDHVKVSNPLTNLFALSYDLIFGKLIFNTSSVNVAISSSVKKFIQKFDNRDIPVIYRGINTRQIDDIRPNTDISVKNPQKLKFIYTGRLYKWKGVENTIKAISSLPLASRQKIQFFVVGEGEDLLALKAISGPEIVFMGPQKWENTISMLKACDVYIHSALPGGGLSTSLIEAAYCNLSLIATPNEGAGEIIGLCQNVYSLDSPDYRGIAKGIEHFLVQKTSHKKKKNLKIQKMFSWTSCINRYIYIINNLCAE